MKRVLLALSLVCVMFVAATAAQAEPVVISDWSYTSDSVLMNAVFGGSGTRTEGVTPKGLDGKELTYEGGTANGYSTYRWGNSGNTNSSLSVQGHEGTIKINAGSEPGVTITHSNTAIGSQYKTLVSGTIFTTVQLSGGGANLTVGSALNFNFYETPNEKGVLNDDIFFMTANEIYNSLSEFEVGGVTYYVSLYTKLNELSGEALRMAQEFIGADSSTMLYGWTTTEGQTSENAYELSLKVTLTPPSVPVPGAVWLLGTGLAGLAALRRRNKN